MVHGHAPALKRVSVYHGDAGNTLALQATIRAARARWRGFPESGSGRARLDSTQQSPSLPVLARLEALVLSVHCSDLYHINSWRALTDFGFLRRFTPPSELKPEALDLLTSMAVENKFRSLQALNLSVAAVSTEWGSPTVDGRTSLLLRIQRQQGKPEEVAVYRALAKLPRLRRATLVLDCYVPSHSPIYNNAYAGAEAKAQAELCRIHETLANSAVDGALTRAIFDELTAAGAPLERLSVKSEPGLIGIRNLDCLARWVARSWVCELRGHEKEEPVVWEDVEGGWIRGDRLQFFRNTLEWADQECREVWADMWPSKGGDWRDEWSSFALSARGLDG